MQILSKITDALHGLMVAKLAKDGRDIQRALNPTEAHAWHMATGVSGEAGELLEIVLENESITGDVLTHFLEECGDSEFYLRAILDGLGMPRNSETRTDTDSLERLVSKYNVAASNLLDVTKKIVVYRKHELSEENHFKAIDALKEATQKCVLLLNEIYAKIGTTVEEVVLQNVDKLYLNKDARYGKEGYSDEAANARADKAQEEKAAE